MSRGKSMFDEKKDFIAERLAEGAKVKEIYEELGPDWYCYESLYYYIRKNFGKVTNPKLNCDKCQNLIWMQAPYKAEKLPVCPVKNRVFRRDLCDCPYKCEYFEAMNTI